LHPDRSGIDEPGDAVKILKLDASQECAYPGNRQIADQFSDVDSETPITNVSARDADCDTIPVAIFAQTPG
jgi:hypothetical protein